MGLIDKLNAIGDAIREMNGTTELIPLADMPQAIRDIKSGGSRAELEYIESTGGQYIDTGIIPTNHRLKMKFECTSLVTDTVIFSSYGSKSDASNYNTYELIWYSNKWYYAPASPLGNQSSFTPAIHPTEINELDFNTYNKEFVINGTKVANTTGTSRAVLPLYLFIANRDGLDSGKYAKMKLWYAQIYDRDTQELVRDFVPAVDENGVVCLYDNVTKAYFYNQGEGEFIGGYKVQEGGGRNS